MAPDFADINDLSLEIERDQAQIPRWPRSGMEVEATSAKSPAGSNLAYYKQFQER